jgi:hypothetical protein
MPRCILDDVSARPYYAIIFNQWPDEPVYHLQAPLQATDGEYLSLNATRCGRTIGPYTPWLARKHVVKYARLCKSCEAAS